jgi:hypothetical protein
MKLTNFLVVKAIISLAFGIALVLVPAAFMSIYGLTLGPNGVLMGRFLGATLIGIGLICWQGRSVADDALQGITLSLFVGDTVGFVVALVAQLSGLMSALGWIVVAIWFFLALGLGYFRFLKPAGVEQTRPA